MSKFKAFFNNKRVLMVLSLLLSVVIWFVISILYSPVTERTISDVSINIPLSSSESTSYMSVFKGNDTKVHVKVTGKKYVVERLTADAIAVNANIDSINGAGDYTLELSAQKLMGGDYTIESIYPSRVNVMLDVEKTIEFSEVPIECVGATIDTVNDPNQSLLLEPTFVQKENSILSITGPDSELKRIKSVKAIAEVNQKITKTTNYQSYLEMYDDNGNVLFSGKSERNELKYAVPSFTTAEISANINLRKTVPIKLNLQNGPLNPPVFKVYEVTGGTTTTEITTVGIKGSPEVIKGLNNIVLDGSVNFAEFDLSKLNQQFKLTLPVLDNVTYDEYSNVSDVYFVAVANVSKYSKKTVDVDASKIIVKNLDSNLVSSVQTALKGITIVGTQSELEDVTSDDLTVVVDCANVTTGTTISPQITISKYNSCWIAGTYQVTVDITSK